MEKKSRSVEEVRKPLDRQDLSAKAVACRHSLIDRQSKETSELLLLLLLLLLLVEKERLLAFESDDHHCKVGRES